MAYLALSEDEIEKMIRDVQVIKVHDEKRKGLVEGRNTEMD